MEAAWNDKTLTFLGEANMGGKPEGKIRQIEDLIFGNKENTRTLGEKCCLYRIYICERQLIVTEILRDVLK